jgi:alcohol dehydrogenase
MKKGLSFMKHSTRSLRIYKELHGTAYPDNLIDTSSKRETAVLHRKCENTEQFRNSKNKKKDKYMNLIQHICCRAYQGVFRAALPFLPYREPEILHRCEGLPDTLKQHKIKKTLIVTDPGIVACGLITKITSVLAKEKISYSVYDQTSANPTVRNVEEALALYQKEHCQALLAIGGGSAMDCAKALGARIACPKKTLGQLKGTLHVLHRIPLLIAVPTTAGTGSENTLAAVITDSEKKHKYVLNDFVLIPRYAILDAELTYSLPPHLTATTGMDALTHAVEAYIGRSTTKETREKALLAVKTIYQNIETAYHDGHNHAAREQMLNAAYLAGFAFSRSYVGYVHAVAHSLGGQYNIPHGLANAVLLPEVLESYGSCIHKKLHMLGCAAGVCTEQDSIKAGAGKFIASIRTLNKNMGIPDFLSGIQERDIETMSVHAAKEANPLYPVPKLMTRRELEAFYRLMLTRERAQA